ncbi:MAG: SEC-C domain-containing protein [Propionibacteriales bacterium]|nr:SEC-C domain-containing protein [Propionibacteriales bacterium]
MSKKSRAKVRSAEAVPRAEGEVGPREPCPCGSGRRYKACHGSPGGAPAVWSARPFAGLAGECDVIAMREFVPAATAPLRLKGSDREVVLCTLLPGATPGMVRESGAIWLGLQVQHAYGDPSRDLAAVLESALVAEPGSVVGLPADPGAGATLQELVEGEIEVTVHDGFGFWADDLDDADGSVAAALEQANAAAAPTTRLEGVEAAYWTSMGEREFLRWVRPEDEDALLDALARLHAAREDHLVEGARLIGMFRAHGVLAPVWDLPQGTGAEPIAAPAAAFDRRLAETLADPRPLHTAERAARSGLTSRQLTIR